jgi:hypothetical protein
MVKVEAEYVKSIREKMALDLQESINTLLSQRAI